jgi:hypothetical protein
MSEQYYDEVPVVSFNPKVKDWIPDPKARMVSTSMSKNKSRISYKVEVVPKKKKVRINPEFDFDSFKSNPETKRY